jgi:hypothetical protein
MKFALLGCSLFLSISIGQQAKEGAAGDAQKLVKIQRILVEGTRLPTLSVIHLAQIKAGDEVNFIKLHSALQKVAQSGLIRNIDFEYESVPDSETDVVLHLICTDEKPSATASINIPKVSEEDIWKWLVEVDPLFTRQMPPTEAAIRLYSNWIGKFMESHGDPKFQENFAVTTDASSSTGGTTPDKLVFKVVKRRGAR